MSGSGRVAGGGRRPAGERGGAWPRPRGLSTRGGASRPRSPGRGTPGLRPQRSQTASARVPVAWRAISRGQNSRTGRAIFANQPGSSRGLNKLNLLLRTGAQFLPRGNVYIGFAQRQEIRAPSYEHRHPRGRAFFHHGSCVPKQKRRAGSGPGTLPCSASARSRHRAQQATVLHVEAGRLAGVLLSGV